MRCELCHRDRAPGDACLEPGCPLRRDRLPLPRDVIRPYDDDALVDDCPRCHGHRWLIWHQPVLGRPDLPPEPLIQSCERCNALPPGELRPPPLYVPPPESAP